MSNLSYIIKRMERKHGAHCFDCLRLVRFSLILEGELCLVIRDNNATISRDQYFHWMCVSDPIMSKVQEVIMKQDILEDHLLNKYCKERVISAIENGKVQESQYDDNDFISHHQLTLRYVTKMRGRLNTIYGKNVRPLKKIKTKQVEEVLSEEKLTEESLLEEVKKLDLNE